MADTGTSVKSWRDRLKDEPGEPMENHMISEIHDLRALIASRPAELDRLLITERVADSMARHGVHYQSGMGAMIVDLMGSAPSHTTNKEK